MEVWAKYRWAVILFGFVMFGAIHTLIFPQPPAARPVPARPAIPAATVTFGQIQDARLKMTTARWEVYRAGLRGRGTAGTGWVVDVTRTWRGSYAVQLSPLPPLPFFPVTSGIWVDGLPAGGAVGLTKGQKVRYAGRITVADKALGCLVVRLNPGEVAAF